MEKSFSTKAAFSAGWAKLKERPFFLISLFIIVIALNGVFEIFVPEDGSVILELLVTLASVYVSLGLVTTLLDQFDGDEPSYKTLIQSFGDYWRFLLATILSTLVTGVAAIPAIVGAFLLTASPLLGALCILLGFILVIVVAARLIFISYIVVDQGHGPVNAVKESFALTKGETLGLVGFMVLLVLLNVVGALLLGVGLLVTMPLSALATIYVYRQMAGEGEVIIIEDDGEAAPAA